MTISSTKSASSRPTMGSALLGARTILAIVALALGYLPLGASAQTPWDLTPETKEPVQGRLYNLTDEPIVFRLHRSYGVVWTDPETLPPDGLKTISPPTSGKSEILGVRGDGKGYVILQYPNFGGKVTVRLPARNPSDNKLEPNWFFVKDINGFKRLIQANDKAAAQAVQAGLQDPSRRENKRLTPEEIVNHKKSLRANWVLSDEGDAELTFRRGNTR